MLTIIIQIISKSRREKKTESRERKSKVYPKIWIQFLRIDTEWYHIADIVLAWVLSEFSRDFRKSWKIVREAQAR